MKKQNPKPQTSNVIKIIGTKLREFRKVQNLTQQQLADVLEISVAYTGDLERGVTDPSLKMLERIANILNVPLSELLSEKTISEQKMWVTRLNQLLPKFSNKQLANLYELLTSLLKK